MNNFESFNFDDFMKELQGIAEDNKDFNNKFKEQESQIDKTIQQLIMIESWKAQLQSKLEKQCIEYDQLKEEAKEKKLLDSLSPSEELAEKLQIYYSKENKEQQEEHKDIIINNSAIKDQLIEKSYEVSAKLNNLRYNARKTPEEEQEYEELIATVSALNKVLNLL